MFKFRGQLFYRCSHFYEIIIVSLILISLAASGLYIAILFLNLMCIYILFVFSVCCGN